MKNSLILFNNRFGNFGCQVNKLQAFIVFNQQLNTVVITDIVVNGTLRMICFKFASKIHKSLAFDFIPDETIFASSGLVCACLVGV
jgi:hypothetical protein